MTFVTPEGEVEAAAGDLMTVPPGAVHTFKNASETEDCECYMTATPGHYADCKSWVSRLAAGGNRVLTE
jgi:mannose-6-phosphate isomerase-like protein (cupin superfamily)